MISNNQIMSIYRGDTFRAPIFINVGSRKKPIRYILRDGDELYVGISEPNKPFEESIVRQVYTSKDLNANRDVEIRLRPIDTEFLMPGRYYLSVKLKAGCCNKIATIIPKKQFFILEG